jgi:hypothetical protein
MFCGTQKKYLIQPQISPYLGQSRAFYELGAFFFSKNVHSETKCDFGGGDGGKLIYFNFGVLAKKLISYRWRFFQAHQMESHLVSPSLHGFEWGVLRNANLCGLTSPLP